MSTTAYSVDRCQGTYDYSSGTTYYYSTTRSQHDRLTTPLCSETAALYLHLSHARTHVPEVRCRRISLIGSLFTPPPRKRAQRRLLGDYTGAANNHPYHTTRRLTPSASAPLVVSYALVPRYAQHKPPCRTSIRPYLQIRINYPTHKTNKL